jgi:hypothetical protein
MSHLLDIINSCKEHGGIAVQYHSLIPSYFKSEIEMRKWAKENNLIYLFSTKYQTCEFHLAQNPPTADPHE